MELLRLATAGSVDDGKSTLIGRLLYDSKAIFEDQLASVERASVQRGHEYTNLALLTDGLRAEREQGITIDVAYRYFATPRRKFIIADTPGHVQYTRNMVTGASTADVAVVLVDARKGLLEQSRRHAYLATLLRIPHLVLAVNKMDLVGWDEERFRSIVAEFSAFKQRLPGVAEGPSGPPSGKHVTFIPLSALRGDNVVDRSAAMAWYEGPALLEHLETVHIAEDRNLVNTRFPVQYVIRPMSDAHHDYRGYAGQVAGGVLRPGDDVVVLPDRQRSRVAGIDTYDGPVGEAFTGMSVTVRLTDDLDISRGDMIVRAGDEPSTSQDVEALVCWMVDQPLRQGGRYAVKHTTRWARAMVAELAYRLDINTLTRDDSATELALNEIGRVRLRVTAPLMHDPYTENRLTGSFILVDEATNVTAGAGMISAAEGVA